MSYTKVFENDIFISYAHIDNRKLPDEQDGWIENFHKALEVRLEEFLGEDAKIWRDKKLQGNDLFSDTLVEQLPKVAILVSVLSPRYVKSAWCVKEVDEFLKAAQARFGLTIGNKSRIFKVVKTPVSLEAQPNELQGMLGYEFFELDPDTGRPSEYRHTFGEKAAVNYYAKLNDLAWDIHKLLEDLIKTNGNGAALPAAPDPQKTSAGPPVYLAQTTSDLRKERDKIQRELLDFGFDVLPNVNFPLEADEAIKQIQEDLTQCKLSIHLVGATYGVVPEGETRSFVHLQNDLASELSAKGKLTRLIWKPAELEIKDPRQAALIEWLENDSAAQEGADLLQTPLEELKSIIKEKLVEKPKKEEKPAEAAVEDAGPLRVYLICDQVDLDATADLEEYLFDQGFEVFIPTFDADEAAARQDHQEYLKLCDAAIIYYGQANDRWVRAKLLDLIKAAGYGRQKPLTHKMVYIDPPETPRKKRFRTHEAMVLQGAEKFSPEVVATFIAALGAENGGQG